MCREAVDLLGSVLVGTTRSSLTEEKVTATLGKGVWARMLDATPATINLLFLNEIVVLKGALMRCNTSRCRAMCNTITQQEKSLKANYNGCDGEIYL